MYVCLPPTASYARTTIACSVATSLSKTTSRATSRANAGEGFKVDEEEGNKEDGPNEDVGNELSIGFLSLSA